MKKSEVSIQLIKYAETTFHWQSFL